MERDVEANGREKNHVKIANRKCNVVLFMLLLKTLENIILYYVRYITHNGRKLLMESGRADGS